MAVFSYTSLKFLKHGFNFTIFLSLNFYDRNNLSRGKLSVSTSAKNSLALEKSLRIKCKALTFFLNDSKYTKLCGFTKMSHLKLVLVVILSLLNGVGCSRFWIRALGEDTARGQKIVKNTLPPFINVVFMQGLAWT